MVKETIKSSVGSVTSVPSRSRSSSIVEAIPEALASGLGKTLGEFITNEGSKVDGIAKHSCGEDIESDLMDAVEQILLGNYRVAHFVNLLKSVNLTVENKAANVSVANVLWLWGTQTDPNADATKWQILSSLVRDVAASGLVDQNVLKTALEFNLLVAAGLMRDEPAHQKRMIKLNTNLVFKQQKYNLLREETEGYSKLSVMLCNEMPDSAHIAPAQVAAEMAPFIKNVFSVVGHFDLDPNRVLDLILDAFEEQPLNTCFLPLVERFRHGSIAQILGFKFTLYHLPRVLKGPETVADGAKPAAASAIGSNDGLIRKAHADTVGSDAPQSLYILAAMLIVSNLVDLEDLLPYLRPSLEKLTATLAALEGELTAQANSFGVVSLNAAKATSKASSDKPSAGLVTAKDKDQLAVVPVSVDVTKEIVVKPVAASSGRRSAPPPLAVPATTGVTTMPVPPSVRPPLPAAPPAAAVSKSASVALLNRVQSASKLGVKGSGASANDAVVLVSDEEVAGDAQFGLFYDPAYLPAAASVPTSQESGEVHEVPAPDATSAESPLSTAFAQGNEIVGLIAALISLRGWQHARYLLNLLELQGVDPLLVMKYSADLRASMAALVQWQLETVYQAHTLGGAARGFAKPVSILPIVKSSAVPAAGAAPVHNKSALEIAADFIAKAPNASASQLRQVASLSAFAEEANLTLSYFGYHVREYPALYARLCRLCRAVILSSQTGDTTAAESDAALEPVVALISNVLLPGLSAYAENNPFLAGQVWTAISSMPFAQRFAVYDRWYGGGVGKEGLGSKHSEVVLAETVALHGARAELKRLAKENTKQVGRKLARFTLTCPLVVFNHVLGQVEAFDNLIPYMVDTLKFSTELANDVMAYSLITQLKKGSNADAKLKKGDTHFSQWFSALTKFIATFYCRYPATELKGLFNYLLQRMSVGDSLDLLVLKELLGIMGSSETLLEVSAAQLEGLSGGRSLRAEVMGLAGGVVGSKGMITANACKKATVILRDELIGSSTAIPLLLMIAQVRSRLLHDAETKQLKLISHLYDTAQDVLMQFTEFLVAGAKSFESIAELMPDLSVLLGEVGLAVPVAFQLVRPLLRAALQYGVDPSAAPPRLQRWHPFGQTMADLVSTLIRPASLWEVMTPRFYILFWGLGLYDIKVPVARYEGEIKRLKDKYADLDHKKTTATAGSLGVTPVEFSKLAKARELEMKQVLQKVTDLTQDLVNQKKHVEAIRDIVRAEQATFFRAQASVPVAEAAVGEGDMEVVAAVPQRPEEVVSENIMQHLLFQRLLMSPLDAVYCTQFCLLLHEMQTPLFSTLHLLDRTIRTITPLIFCTTETEASFIGYALLDLLQVTNRWHDGDEATFNAEARDKLGFSFPLSGFAASAVADVNKETVEGAEEDGMEVEEPVVYNCDFARFKELCKEWHTRMFSVIKASLKVKDREYIYIRSGLILLAKVSEQFPARAKEGDQLITIVEQLVALETKRGDLQIMAKSLITILKKRADGWLNDSPARRIAALKKEAAAAKARAAAELKEQQDREAKEANSKDAPVAAASAPAEGGGRGRGNAAPASNSNNAAAGDNRRGGPAKDEPWRRGDTVDNTNNSRSHEALPSRHDTSRDSRDPPSRSNNNRDSRDRGSNAPAGRGGSSAAPASSRDNQDAKRRSSSRDRDRRGNAPSGGNNSSNSAANGSNTSSNTQASGVKRKQEDDRVERSTSGGNAPNSNNNVGNNGSASQNKSSARRSEPSPAPTPAPAAAAHAKSNANVEEGPRASASTPAVQSNNNSNTDNKDNRDARDNRDGRDSKATTSGAGADRQDNSRSDRNNDRNSDRKPPQREPLSNRGTYNGGSSNNNNQDKDKDVLRDAPRDGNNKDANARDGGRDKEGRDDRRDSRAQDRPTSALAATTANTSSNCNNKRSREAADLPADASSGANISNNNQSSNQPSNKRRSAERSTSAPEMTAAPVLAAGGQSQAAELLEMKKASGAVSNSSRRSGGDQQGPSLMSLKMSTQDAEGDRRGNSDRRPSQQQQAPAQRSQSQSDLPQLQGSNNLFPASKNTNNASNVDAHSRRGSGRFEDRSARQQQQGGGGSGGYDNSNYGNNPPQGHGYGQSQQGYVQPPPLHAPPMYNQQQGQGQGQGQGRGDQRYPQQQQQQQGGGGGGNRGNSGGGGGSGGGNYGGNNKRGGGNRN